MHLPEDLPSVRAAVEPVHDEIGNQHIDQARSERVVDIEQRVDRQPQAQVLDRKVDQAEGHRDRDVVAQARVVEKNREQIVANAARELPDLAQRRLLPTDRQAFDDQRTAGQHQQPAQVHHQRRQALDIDIPSPLKLAWQPGRDGFQHGGALRPPSGEQAPVDGGAGAGIALDGAPQHRVEVLGRQAEAGPDDAHIVSIEGLAGLHVGADVQAAPEDL